MAFDLRRSTRTTARWASPAALILAGFCLLLPFLAVSCDAPGGYGRAAPGGTTTYTGWDLAVGGAPEVTPDHLRPAAQAQDDTLPPQPLAIAVLVLVVAGLAAALAIGGVRARRAATALAAAIGVVFLVANQATARALLESRLREQLTAPMPSGKTAADFIADQGGFALCLLLLTLVAIFNAVGWLRAPAAPAPAPAAGPSPPPSPPSGGGDAAVSGKLHE
ncbi:hypothetical protein QEZ54_15860 [Catellatospora sp. KI3]|uniref:hypothetical protein n=1 Tax=Catellatospora sp. KI3 TaxID=3041620 RepID=UPI0024825651|nr:hypothetical protein [Catellatospora sp. KI3]MDI1462447.1 hypothetical protein [Catellatospora sp. KI3]